jgi:ligand-binding sensor protein
METYFDFAELEKRLKDFYTVSRIRVAVFDIDFKEICDYPKERAPFCALIRKNEKCDKVCQECDRTHMEEASRMKVPYIYTCHAGLSEIIAPMIFSGQLIGYLFFAHILDYQSHEEAWETLKKAVIKYSADLDEAKAELFKMPLYGSEYLEAASSLLQAAASYLCVSRIAYLRFEDLPSKIDKYIASHLGGDLTASKLCKEFGLGRTTLYELSGKVYKEGIAEHIRKLRIEKAKAMLEENPDLKIAAVASEVGFEDYSYFIVAFKRATGMTPKKYIKKIESENIS